MKIEIKVPSMGESISEVMIGTILKPSGAFVKVDEPILEIETDKVNQQLYSPVSGILSLNVKSGDRMAVGQIIGEIESVEQQVVQTVEKTQTPPPLPKKEQDEEPTSMKTSEEKGNIRYTKEEFLKDLREEKPSSPSISQRTIPQSRETRRPMSNLRRVIAQRLVEAQHTTAMLTTFNEIDLSQIILLREKYKDIFIKKYGVKLGFMSFFVKACVSALEIFPDLNSYISEEEIVHREYYDIGIAVGTERGLIVPVLRNCDQLSFAQIEQAIEGYVKKAKEAKLSVEDLQGGGFTITNGGVYGSLLSTPILNPPQSGILGMHKIEKRPVSIEDQVVIRPMMYLALSYDHRIVDGKEAVSFLVHIKNILEEPSRLLLEI